MAINRPTRSEGSVNLSEIGSTGLNAYGGTISEESLRQLAGTKGIKTFAEMRDNDDTVGAVLFIIDKLLRNVAWKVEPADNSPEAIECAEFMKTCMDDMEHSWGDFISEVLSMLPFGWSSHELVYKVRGGTDTTNKSYHSEYDDNKIGWRKLPIRSQESLFNWEFDESGDVTAMQQQPPSGSVVTIPIEKLLIFRTQSYKNNPMGRSILRNAYRPWFFKKRIEEIEGIGIERDLAGLPVASVPAELLSASATPDQKASLNAIKKLVTSIRRDRQEGVVFPLVYDEMGNLLYKLELLSTGGTRQFDTNAIVMRYGKAIAMTVLADFIFLGQSKVGSYALSSDKTDMFSAGLGAWLGSIADVINRSARPKLMKLNGYERKVWGTFKPADIEKEDVSKFCENVYKLVGVGALVPDDELNTKIRELLGVPPTTSTITPLSQIEDEMKIAQEQRAQDKKNAEMQAKQPKVVAPVAGGKQNMPGLKADKGGNKK
jgi:hypothetical protein